MQKTKEQDGKNKLMFVLFIPRDIGGGVGPPKLGRSGSLIGAFCECGPGGLGLGSLPPPWVQLPSAAIIITHK